MATKAHWRRHFGGISASTPEAFANALVKAADDERGHVSRDELRDICRLVLRKLRAGCPCGLGGEPWHVVWVCDEGRRIKSELSTDGG